MKGYSIETPITKHSPRILLTPVTQGFAGCNPSPPPPLFIGPPHLISACLALWGKGIISFAWGVCFVLMGLNRSVFQKSKSKWISLCIKLSICIHHLLYRSIFHVWVRYYLHCTEEIAQSWRNKVTSWVGGWVRSRTQTSWLLVPHAALPKKIPVKSSEMLSWKEQSYSLCPANGVLIGGCCLNDNTALYCPTSWFGQSQNSGPI